MSLAQSREEPILRPRMGETVYFDLETQRSFNDVGGSSNIVKMGVSVACAYSTKTGKYELYREEELDGLVTLLTKADLVVGHNHVRFDYGVLEAYTVLDLGAQTVNLDMLIDLEKKTARSDVPVSITRDDSSTRADGAFADLEREVVEMKPNVESLYVRPR